MNQNEILKKIDDLIIETDTCLEWSHFTRESDCYKNSFDKLKDIMKNYEKVLEVNHFKQTEL